MRSLGWSVNSTLPSASQAGPSVKAKPSASCTTVAPGATMSSGVSATKIPGETAQADTGQNSTQKSSSEAKRVDSWRGSCWQAGNIASAVIPIQVRATCPLLHASPRLGNSSDSSIAAPQSWHQVAKHRAVGGRCPPSPGGAGYEPGASRAAASTCQTTPATWHRTRVRIESRFIQREPEGEVGPRCRSRLSAAAASALSCPRNGKANGSSASADARLWSGRARKWSRPCCRPPRVSLCRHPSRNHHLGRPCQTASLRPVTPEVLSGTLVPPEVDPAHARIPSRRRRHHTPRIGPASPPPEAQAAVRGTDPRVGVVVVLAGLSITGLTLVLREHEWSLAGLMGPSPRRRSRPRPRRPKSGVKRTVT